jgi:hypothetical protein
MADNASADIASLRAEAQACRKLAGKESRLAWQITDTAARASLEKHVEELDKRAQELEARVAVMKQSTQETGPEPEQDIAALKAPPEEPGPTA